MIRDFLAKFKKPIIVLVGLSIAALIVFLFVLLPRPPTEYLSKIPLVSVPMREDPFKDLLGKIYLTLAVEGDDITDLYVFDVDTRRITPLFDSYGEEDFGDKFLGITSKFSPRGNEFAYMAAPAYRDSQKPEDIKIFLGLFTYNVDTRSWKAVSKSRLHNKRLPQWSSDGARIVFNAMEQRVESYPTDNLENWSVYVTDLSGTERRITSGAYPYWSPRGDILLFLRDDGLYTYDFSSKEIINVLVLPKDRVKINTKLGVSSDGSLLALSAPRNVNIFKIVSWKPFQLSFIKNISEIASDGSATDFYWPVFSPDSRYLVLQATEWDTETRTIPINPRLVVYELRGFKKKVVGSLEGFNFQRAFTTDWRY